MELDMYLTRRHYVGPLSQYTVTLLRDGRIASNIWPERIMFVIEQVAYWREVNQIHCWFVEHVQGKDDCGDYYVEFAQLQALLKTIDTVLEEPSCAGTMLPDTFGDTKFDENYFNDLRHTKDMLLAILAEPDADKTDYYYSSS